MGNGREEEGRLEWKEELKVEGRLGRGQSEHYLVLCKVRLVGV